MQPAEMVEALEVIICCPRQRPVWGSYTPVVKGNGVYEAVVSTLSWYTLRVVPLFSKASVVQIQIQHT